MAFKSMFGALSELVADSITGAIINGGTITGAIIQTAAAGRRFVFQPFGVGTFIKGYNATTEEAQPATIDASGLNGIGQLMLTGPEMYRTGQSTGASSGQALFYLAGRGDQNPPFSEIQGTADHARLQTGLGAYVDVKDDDVRILGPDSAWLTANGAGGAVVNAATASVNVNAGNDVNVTATDQIVLNAGTKVNAANQTIDLTGGTLDLSGDSISKIKMGSTVVTIGAAASTGTQSVAHGQGTAPDIVVCTAANGVIGYYANVDTYNTTNISLRASQRDGTAGAASVTVNWLAIWK